MEVEVTAAKSNLEALKASQDSASSDAALAASVEHDALVKAQTDFADIAVETEALKAAHAQALEEATSKLQVLEAKAARVETLEAEITSLKSEKEDTANKLSELEIEILELRESQETAEDEHTQALARLKSLEEQLSAATVATEQAIEEAKSKEESHSRAVEDLNELHEEALQAASEEQAKVAAQLDALKVDLAEALAAREQAKADRVTAEENHARQVQEAEKEYLNKQSELSEQIQKITAELEVRFLPLGVQLLALTYVSTGPGSSI